MAQWIRHDTTIGLVLLRLPSTMRQVYRRVILAILTDVRTDARALVHLKGRQISEVWPGDSSRPNM